jgi:hypothetical protein
MTRLRQGSGGQAVIPDGFTLQVARRAWGDELPDWVAVLAARCDSGMSQQAAGVALGVGASTVNQVIHRKYGANLARIEARVRGKFMAETVACPVLGEVRRDQCLRWQGAKLRTTSPEAVRLHRTCPTCPNNLRPRDASPAATGVGGAARSRRENTGGE